MKMHRAIRKKQAACKKIQNEPGTPIEAVWGVKEC